ncbi:SCO7613 C-terminal domain-containing membrane protein [Leifsonia sp. NPDC058248]|uniref:SCO7613 C-terminal domain-containing membrane protein n=1 Tax=Leifsonia sp. NPDC058248 TaxID=3346402 RepID=UPI0036DBB086
MTEQLTAPPAGPTDDRAAGRWTTATIAYLHSEQHCPRCLEGALVASVCQACGADLTGSAAGELRMASAEAARALANRQRVIDGLPVAVLAARSSSAPAPTAAAAPPPSAPTAPAPPSPAADARQVSVQSVLAVAGAGLLAIASFVFTFLNPDLTDVGIRSTIVAVVALVFLTGAWLLSRRSLRFSAETIGALGLLFVVVDGWSIATVLPDSAATRLVAAAVTLAGSALAIVVAERLRMRTWLWSGLVGATLVPAIAASALAPLAGERIAWIVGGLGMGFAGLAAFRIIRRLAPTFESPLRTDRVTTTTLQLIGLAAALLQVTAVTAFDSAWHGTGILVAVLAAATALALLSARQAIPGFWSATAGVLGVLTAAAIPLQFELAGSDAGWQLLLVPLAATAALTGAAALPPIAAVQRSSLLTGATVIARLAVVPAALVVLTELLAPSRPADAVVGLAAILALAVASAGSLALLRLRPLNALHEKVAAVAFAVAAVVGVAVFTTIPAGPRSVVAVVLGAGLALAVTRVQRLRRQPLSVRMPVILGAHLLILDAAAIAWAEPWSRVGVGAACVAALALLAATVPRVARPAYVSAGFLFGLIVVGASLDLTHLDPTANLCITTAIGVLVAIGATVSSRMSVDTWVAVLASAALPFLITVGMVVVARSGWTALPTAFTFALALTIVLDRRGRVHRMLRGLAAATLIPSLAVVVITLGAQFLRVSASPVTLPIIALIIACAVPSTAAFGELLSRRGLPVEHVSEVRLWIELSALVTAVIAVALAILRSAAGAETAFLVFLILGIGAAATARLTRRRYAWWAAGVCWTGALWSVWAVAGVTAAELYIVPPALAAAVVGAVVVGRGRAGLPLYASGLACAVAPTLALLILAGAGDPSDPATGTIAFPWRTVVLLVVALVLAGFATLVARRSAARVAASPFTRWATRLGTLEKTTLVVAIAAAASGAVQGLRYAFGVDAIAVRPELVILPVLAFALPAAAIASYAGWRLDGHAPSRFLQVPALLFLIAGSLFANRLSPVPIAILWVLTALLLGGMLVTTVRGLRGTTSLPPVWVWFVLAWFTAVAGWSMRELRVEAFSLPLGLALLAAGVIAFAGTTADDAAALPGVTPVPAPATATARGTLNTWPAGFTGSWPLLAPGIVVTLLPSVLATATDPLTWRAILVIALALVSILIGSLRRLAAPFILGLIVLPIENAIVFVVQIGRSIGALPWWITLATAGAVLLVLAVSSERKTSGLRSATARLRDLR